MLAVMISIVSAVKLCFLLMMINAYTREINHPGKISSIRRGRRRRLLIILVAAEKLRFFASLAIGL